jgi:hypothetical protein
MLHWRRRLGTFLFLVLIGYSVFVYGRDNYPFVRKYWFLHFLFVAQILFDVLFYQYMCNVGDNLKSWHAVMRKATGQDEGEVAMFETMEATVDTDPPDWPT